MNNTKNKKLNRPFDKTALATLVVAILVSSMSFIGLATVSMQWVGPEDAESYYGTSQLHSAALVSSFSVELVLVSLLIGIFFFICTYKLFLRHKSR